MAVHLESGDRSAALWTCVVVAPARPFGASHWDHGCICRRAGPEGGLAPQRVRVAWPGPVDIGMRVETVARWTPWEVTLGFDAVRAYRPAGWGSRLEPVNRNAQALGEVVRPGLHRLYLARRALENRWKELLSPRVAAFLTGLSTGSTADMDDGLVDAFAESGLVHVLSVSGYHVGLLGFLPLLLLRGKRRMLRYIGFALLVPLWAYMGICGWAVPAVRACAMSTVYGLGAITGRPVTAVHAWSVALLCVVVWRPCACAQLGTQLSFIAVLGIVVAASAVRNKAGRLVAVSAAATASTAPLTAPLFGMFPWAFLPVNAVAGPWVSFIGAAGLATLLAPSGWGCAHFLEVLAGGFLDTVVWATEHWQLSWSVGDVPEVFWWWGLAVGVVALVHRWGVTLRMGFLLLIAVWPWTIVQTERDSIPDWVMVRSAHPAMLFRTGNSTWCFVADSATSERALRTYRSLPPAWRTTHTPCTPCRQAEHGAHGVSDATGAMGVADGVPFSIRKEPGGRGLFRWGPVAVPWERWGEAQAGPGPNSSTLVQ
jgi:ComEC/Rec2-related protein